MARVMGPHRCAGRGCPCTSTWNGQPGEHCCKSCAQGTPCRYNNHPTPTQPAAPSKYLVSAKPSTWHTPTPAAPAPSAAAPKHFAKCVRFGFGCPCTASWNGQPGEYCCKQCKAGTRCLSNRHPVPQQLTAPAAAPAHSAGVPHSSSGTGGARPHAAGWQHSHQTHTAQGAQGQAPTGFGDMVSDAVEGVKSKFKEIGTAVGSAFSSAGDDTAHHEPMAASAYSTRRSCVRPDCKNLAGKGLFCSAECEKRGRHKTTFKDPRGHVEPCALVPFYFPGRDEPWDALYCSSFLGNFYECEAGVTLSPPRARGEKGHFTNAEAAFHALKHWNERKHFEKASGEQSFQLKKTYQHYADPKYCGYGSNWHAMQAVLDAKYLPGSKMARELIGTGNAFLLEHAARPIEKYWSDNSDGTGSNWLGLQLMLLRDKLSDDTGKGGKRWTDFITSNVNMTTGADISGEWQRAVRSATQAVVAELSDRGVEKSSYSTRGGRHLSPEAQTTVPRHRGAGPPVSSMITEQGGVARSEAAIGGPSSGAMPSPMEVSDASSSHGLGTGGFGYLKKDQEKFVTAIKNWQTRRVKELGPKWEATLEPLFTSQLSDLKELLLKRTSLPNEDETIRRLNGEVEAALKQATRHR